MKTLFIVDDQILYLQSLTLALKKKFEILTAQSYDDSIKLLQNKEKNVELALIDIRLNENDDKNIDGLRILEWIRMNKPEISAFMMSSYTEFSYAEKSLNLGAKHFFKKPIDVISLIAILEDKG